MKVTWSSDIMEAVLKNIVFVIEYKSNNIKTNRNENKDKNENRNK